MSTANKGTKNYSTQRIAAASIIGTLGGGLLVATVVRLLQVGKEALPWWWPWPLIIGVTLFVAALLLLVPHSWWKWLGRLLTNTPRNVRTAYWLQSVLRFNKENIYTSVKGRFSTSDDIKAWNFRGLDINPLDPYFQINLELINASIFDICVSGIEGQIVIDSNTCQKYPTVTKQYGIKQGDTFYVVINQPVSDSMLKRLKEATLRKEELRFDLTNVFLNLETTTKGYEGTKIRIKFAIYSVWPN